MWLFNEMDTVTEEVWIESFSRISSLYLRLNFAPAIKALASPVKNALSRDRHDHVSFERILNKADLSYKL